MCEKKGIVLYMTNSELIPSERRKKNDRQSETVILLTLGSLLLFLLTSMGISLFAKVLRAEESALMNVEQPPIVFENGDQSVADGVIREVIVIDAGHGGYDAGCHFDAYYEKDITLQIAKKAGDKLRKRGFQVIYTRESDIALGAYEEEDLALRAQFAQQHQADAFVSLHLNMRNETETERCYGFEVYENKNNAISHKLAQNVHSSFNALEYTTSRGVLDGQKLQIVSMNYRPAILIEMGFLDDEHDRAYLVSEEGQEDIANALCEAMMQTFPSVHDEG